MFSVRQSNDLVWIFTCSLTSSLAYSLWFIDGFFRWLLYELLAYFFVYFPIVRRRTAGGVGPMDRFTSRAVHFGSQRVNFRGTTYIIQVSRALFFGGEIVWAIPLLHNFLLHDLKFASIRPFSARGFVDVVAIQTPHCLINSGRTSVFLF